MGVRKGQGYGARKPPRAICPDCGRKGVTMWRAIAGSQERHCRYCQSSWGPAGWEAAKRDNPDPPPTVEINKATRWKDGKGRVWRVFETLHFGRYFCVLEDRPSYSGEWTARQIRAALAAEAGPPSAGAEPPVHA